MHKLGHEHPPAQTYKRKLLHCRNGNAVTSSPIDVIIWTAHGYEGANSHGRRQGCKLFSHAFETSGSFHFGVCGSCKATVRAAGAFDSFLFAGKISPSYSRNSTSSLHQRLAERKPKPRTRQLRVFPSFFYSHLYADGLQGVCRRLDLALVCLSSHASVACVPPFFHLQSDGFPGVCKGLICISDLTHAWSVLPATAYEPACVGFLKKCAAAVQ